MVYWNIRLVAVGEILSMERVREEGDRYHGSYGKVEFSKGFFLNSKYLKLRFGTRWQVLGQKKCYYSSIKELRM